MLNCSLKLMLRARHLSKLREGMTNGKKTRMMVVCLDLEQRSTRKMNQSLIAIVTVTATLTALALTLIAQAIATALAPIAAALIALVTAPAPIAPAQIAQALIAAAQIAQAPAARIRLIPTRPLQRHLLLTVLPTATAAAPQAMMKCGWPKKVHLPKCLTTMFSTSHKWPPHL